MILSRRSFLKVAGLSAVAVAGASMFTGCGNNNFLTTPVEFVADAADANDDTVKAVVKALNDNKTLTSILGHSDLHGADDQDKDYFTKQLSYLVAADKKAGKSTGYDKVEVKGTKLSTSLNKEGKFDHYYVKVTIDKKTENK